MHIILLIFHVSDVTHIELYLSELREKATSLGPVLWARV